MSESGLSAILKRLTDLAFEARNLQTDLEDEPNRRTPNELLKLRSRVDDAYALIMAD